MRSWKEKNEEWIELYNQGWSCAKIAKKYGTFHGVVSSRLRSLGIDIRYRFSYLADKHALWKGVGLISGKFWSNLKQGAKNRNIPVEITKEYLWELFLKQDGKCAISGKDIILFPIGKDINKNTASVDRINSDIAYIEGNIQWVHKDVNLMKNYFDNDYFIKICKEIANYQNLEKDKL